MASATDLAIAVTGELNGHGFALDFTALYAFRPVYSLEELATLKVTSVPRVRLKEQFARGVHKITNVIDVAIQKQVDATDLADQGSLSDLADEVVDFFMEHTFTAGDPAENVCSLKVSRETICNPEMDAAGYFMAIISMEFMHYENAS